MRVLSRLDQVLFDSLHVGEYVPTFFPQYRETVGKLGDSHDGLLVKRATPQGRLAGLKTCSDLDFSSIFVWCPRPESNRRPTL